MVYSATFFWNSGRDSGGGFGTILGMDLERFSSGEMQENHTKNKERLPGIKSEKIKKSYKIAFSIKIVCDISL